MCLIGLSESGHGGRFEPCEECKRLQEERSGLDTINRNCASENEQLRNELARTQQERDSLVVIVEKADAIEKLLAHVSDCYEHEMSIVTVDKIDGALGKYRKARHAE